VANSQNGIRVEIYDQEYHMKGDLDPEYIQKLAKFLDTKMRSIASRSNTVDSLRVAVLAALNVADEYHQLKARCEEIEEKIGEYSQVLDELLRQAV
jgi:cell division protein ZapA